MIHNLGDGFSWKEMSGKLPMPSDTNVTPSADNNFLVMWQSISLRVRSVIIKKSIFRVLLCDLCALKWGIERVVSPNNSCVSDWCRSMVAGFFTTRLATRDLRTQSSQRGWRELVFYFSLFCRILWNKIPNCRPCRRQQWFTTWVMVFREKKCLENFQCPLTQT